MPILRRYFVTLAVWTVGLLAFLWVAGMGSQGGTPWTAVSRLPALAAFAMTLACFPAGVAVGAAVLAGPTSFPREGVKLTLATLLLASAAFGVIQYVAPSALAGGRLPGAGNAVEPRELSASDLAQQVRDLTRRAEGGSDLDSWRAANTFAFERERRLAHSSLPLFLTWLGALAGFWAGRIRHRQLRGAQLLAMGLFLLVSMYLGGENGYELVALQMAGPAYFVAWLVVLVPGVLGLGLGWPALVALYGAGPSAAVEES